ASSDVMRKWMLNALPSELSDGITDAIHPYTLARMRYEDTPPLLGIPDTEVGSERERAYREADQEMLAASAFIPRCTEFIVEWSFGWTNNRSGDPREGQIVWFGLNRAEADINGDGVIDPNDPEDQVASFFSANLPHIEQLPGSGVRDSDELARISELVMGRSANLPQPLNLVAQEAVFGYFDPGDPADLTDDQAWPWPTMLRITMSFADPTDPSVETTTQFVVDLTRER
ncbi:MAG: hypothetical protein ACIARR_12150, partial [Phycisphaerales bacterium JB059]